MNNTSVFYFLVVGGVVVQKQPYFEEGFIEGPEDVIPGYFYDGTQFIPPPPPPVDYLGINTQELERLQRLANAQVAAVQGRVDTLNDAVELDMATAAEVAEQPVRAAQLKAWKTYRILLGRVPTQADWPTNPVWPTIPEPYTSETSLNSSKAASAI